MVSIFLYKEPFKLLDKHLMWYYKDNNKLARDILEAPGGPRTPVENPCFKSRRSLFLSKDVLKIE